MANRKNTVTLSINGKNTEIPAHHQVGIRSKLGGGNKDIDLRRVAPEVAAALLIKKGLERAPRDGGPSEGFIPLPKGKGAAARIRQLDGFVTVEEARCPEGSGLHARCGKTRHDGETVYWFKAPYAKLKAKEYAKKPIGQYPNGGAFLKVVDESITEQCMEYADVQIQAMYDGTWGQKKASSRGRTALDIPMDTLIYLHMLKPAFENAGWNERTCSAIPSDLGEAKKYFATFGGQVQAFNRAVRAAKRKIEA